MVRLASNSWVNTLSYRSPLLKISISAPFCSYITAVLPVYTLSCHQQICIMNHASKVYLIPSKIDAKVYPLWKYYIFIGGRSLENIDTL
jgi:hypothetical protein